MRLWISRPLFVLVGLLASSVTPDPANAQQPGDLTLAQAESMPAWTVPVLRLVSATHVEPTTGVVLSDGGMVLVPSGFAGPGDEIIVLDGGTNIIRNGRPAKIMQRFSAEGVQVLSVPTLGRKGAAFSSAPLKDGDSLRLSAFPPAELIAQGQPPVEAGATIEIPADGGTPRISHASPLPNVSGALVDSCGNLAGYSSADGVQSMSTGESPRYQWKDTLIRIAGELALEVKFVVCSPPLAGQPESMPLEPEVEETFPEPSQSPEPEATAAEVPEPPVDEPLSESEDTVFEEESTVETELLPPDEALTEQEPAADVTPPDTAPESPSRGWIWLLAAILLLGGGILVHRLRHRGEAPKLEQQAFPTRPSQSGGESDDDEPETAEGDAELIVHGELNDGATFEIRRRINSHAINLLIGRGSADIPIESTAISRRHAELNGTAESLTLSDLGSSNGTSINGVPCLEGETMYINPGDSIVLGNARIQYEIVPDSRRQASE